MEVGTESEVSGVEAAGDGVTKEAEVEDVANVARPLAGVDVLRCQRTSTRKNDGTAMRMARRARMPPF